MVPAAVVALAVVGGGPVTPKIELRKGGQRASEIPIVPGLHVPYSTNFHAPLSGKNPATDSYAPARPDVVTKANGDGLHQIVVAGWGAWWLSSSDVPSVQMHGRDGNGAYASPGVLDGLGVNGVARLAVSNGSSEPRWLWQFERYQARVAPGTTTWICHDGGLGMHVNVTATVLPDTPSGFVLRASVQSAGAATLYWAVGRVGGAVHNDTVEVVSVPEAPGGAVRMKNAAALDTAGHKGGLANTEVYAAATPRPSNVGYGNASILDGLDVPAPSFLQPGYVDPCGLMQVDLPSGLSDSDLFVTWGYTGYSNATVDAALARLEAQREMFHPPAYDAIREGWFNHWIGRTLNPLESFRSLLANPQPAIAAAEQFNSDRRRVQFFSDDEGFDVAISHCAGEMAYQYEYPAFIHGANVDAKYGKISIGTYGATLAGYHEQVELSMQFYAGTQDKLTGRNRYFTPALAISDWCEEQNFYFIEQVLFHAHFTDPDSGMAFLGSIWPAVVRGMEHAVAASDPDGDGFYTGYYEYWDNDRHARGGKSVEQMALAVGALRAASEIATRLGNSTMASRWEETANKVALRIADEMWIDRVGAFSSAEWNGDLRPRPEAQEIFPLLVRGMGDFVTPMRGYLASRYLRDTMFYRPRDNVTLEYISDWWPISWSNQYNANGDAGQSVVGACNAGDCDAYFPMYKTITEGQYFTPDATMGSVQYNDGYAMGFKHMVEMQPGMLEGAIAGFYGVRARFLDDLLVLRPSIPGHWKKAGISTPDLTYSYAVSADGGGACAAGHRLVTVDVSFAGTRPRAVRFELQARGAVKDVTLNGKPVQYSIEEELVGAARVVINSSVAESHNVTLCTTTVKVAGALTVVAGRAQAYVVSGAHLVALEDPQRKLMTSSVGGNRASVTANDTAGQTTVFLKLNASGVVWLHPLDLNVVPQWRIETLSVSIDGGGGRKVKQTDVFQCHPPPCIALPQLFANNRTLAVRLRADAEAVRGTARVQVPALNWMQNVSVDIPAKGQQVLWLGLDSVWSLIPAGSLRVNVALLGQEQTAEAVDWTLPLADDAAARMVELNLSAAYDFDVSELYNYSSHRARWRVDYTGAGIGVMEQLMYNNTARIAVGPLAINNAPPYRGYYIDAPPICNLSPGNVPEQMCHMNSVPGIPNGTIEETRCNVWHACWNQWQFPKFTSWDDIRAGNKIDVPFQVGRYDGSNVLALVSSQPYANWHSAARITLPTPIRAAKVFFLTVNLAKPIKCYMPHAEVEFLYQSGDKDIVQLTPPHNFHSIGGDPGWDAYVPREQSFYFGIMTPSAFTHPGPQRAAVMDVVVPRSEPVAAIDLRVVVTETIFGVMGATVYELP